MDRADVELLRFYERISEQATDEAYSAYLLANAITLQLRASIKGIERRLAEQEARPRWKKLLRRS